MNSRANNRIWVALGFVLFALALMVLLQLGFWQLSRADEKQRVLDQVTASQQAPPDDYSELRALSSASKSGLGRLNYQALRLIGSWQPQRQFLLANRIHKGALGEEVLTPFRLQDGSWLLVNRGWQKKGATPPVPDGQKMPQGLLYSPETGYQLGEAILPVGDSSQWVETLYLDVAAISKALNQPLLPAVLVLDEALAGGLKKTWQPVNIQPARHIGYAVQWFGLALALAVFGVVWLRRMRRG